MFQLKKTYLSKLRIHQGEYEWDDARGLIRKYGPTMLYPIFKSINPDTSIGVSNLKYEIEKSTLSKFGNNVKDLLGAISSNYSILIDKGEHHEDYVRHVFRDLL